MKLGQIKHIHMIGIGGIGMSGLADILRDKGIKITGSDLKHNALVERLRKKGCVVNIGHGKIYGNPDIVVRSFSIRENNPEMVEAKRRGISILERSELLRMIFKSKPKSVAVSGTHGKTTTTAMISFVLDRAGLDPTVLIGGELDYFNGNAKSGKSGVLISEVDESDGLIANISSKYAIITNIEKEHMEHYREMKNLLEAFRLFIGNISNGILFYNRDDFNLSALVRNISTKRISFGTSQDSDYYPLFIKEYGWSCEFSFLDRGKKLGEIILNIPGRHNILNAMAAAACALEFGIGFDIISQALRDFHGVKRRFEVRAEIDDIALIDDYAHHPTEIRAVIETARKLNRNRIITIFQPHRFTRTHYLKKEFLRAFRGIDQLILTDIYPASEDPIEGVNIKNIYKGIKETTGQRVKVLPMDRIAHYLKDIARPRDLILILGAGDINAIIPDIERYLKRES